MRNLLTNLNIYVGTEFNLCVMVNDKPNRCGFFFNDIFRADILKKLVRTVIVLQRFTELPGVP